MFGFSIPVFANEFIFPSIHITAPQSPFADRNSWQNGTVRVADSEYSFRATAARIRGRGNSTWEDGADKRPLRLRFPEPTAMLGSAYEATDWILLSNRFDESLLRNYAALSLAQTSRMYALPTIRNVHLYVNRQYMGVYLLTDERDIGAGRLELEFHEIPSRSGFFIELEPRSGDVVVNDMPYSIRFPNNPEHTEYAAAFLEHICFAIRTRNFEKVKTMIDIPSFVDYYLIQELFKNSDGPLSNFMYIKGIGNERRLYMGPAWDFDISAGVCSGLSLGFHDDQVIIMGLFSLWYRNLMEVSEFRELVATRWNEMRETEIPQMLERINELAENYRTEFERNFARHPSHSARNNFANDIEFLQTWFDARIRWLDNYFNGNDFDPIRALVEFHTNVRPLQVSLDCEHIQFKNSPIILHDRAMVPLSELPFDVTIQRFANAIIIYDDTNIIMNVIGSPIFSVDGTTCDFVVSSVVTNGNVYIPLRQIAEVFGYEVEWNDNSITISYKRADTDCCQCRLLFALR
jgi:hypothetical protein